MGKGINSTCNIKRQKEEILMRKNIKGVMMNFGNR